MLLPRLLLAPLSLLLAAATSPVTVTGPPQPDPNHITQPVGTMTYAVTIDHRPCNLLFSPQENALHLEAKAHDATLEQLAACLAPMLDAVLRGHPGIPAFYVTFSPRDPIMGRVAAILDRSPEWNVRTGGVRGRRTITGVITAAINREHLAHEIAEVFARFGYTLQAERAGLALVAAVPRYANHRLPTDAGGLSFRAMTTVPSHPWAHTVRQPQVYRRQTRSTPLASRP